MRIVIIAPHGDKWAVQAGVPSEIKEFQTQHEAVAYAEERATTLHSYILMPNKAGKLERYNSHVPNSVPDEVL